MKRSGQILVSKQLQDYQFSLYAIYEKKQFKSNKDLYQQPVTLSILSL